MPSVAGGGAAEDAENGAVQDCITADGTAVDQVANDEVLYRRVPRNAPPAPPYYDRFENRLRVLAQAFSEPPIPAGEPFAGQYRLSVDRAKLREFNPDLTRQGVPGRDPESFGVVSMPAEEVRAIPSVADIIPDPILNDPAYPDNPAHALICVVSDPKATKTANITLFRNVRRDLAAAANRRPWEIDPPDDDAA
jgi:hypothetical protein